MANDVIKYKGYYSVVKYDSENGVLYGKVEDIDDLVTFECDDLKNVEEEFKNAVDDYLDFCKEIGKEPSKTYSGVFNVRVSPALHRSVSNLAIKMGITLNAFVSRSLQESVEKAAAGQKTLNGQMSLSDYSTGYLMVNQEYSKQYAS